MAKRRVEQTCGEYTDLSGGIGGISKIFATKVKRGYDATGIEPVCLNFTKITLI